MNKKETLTDKLLKMCEENGISRVAIGVNHPLVPSSVDSGIRTSNDIFTYMAKRHDGFPPIWGIVEKLRISCGCGNTDHHQADISGLIPGVYQLNRSKWLKVA